MQGFSIQSIRDLVKTDFEAVNQLIAQRLYSNVPLSKEVSQHIVASGGKRLRPLVVLLCAKALNYTGKFHVDLAAIIEFIHTATLLHDDVVDNSKLRRGRPTANALWGNEASILVGDFLYSRAFQMMANLNEMRVMEILSDATNMIAEGEVLQLMNRNNSAVNEAYYMQVIRLKTAKLFEAAAQLGAVVSKGSSEQEFALATYGMHLGTAFQLIDDVLDYCADENELGKNLGQDLQEGKPTLPLIYTLRMSSKSEMELIYAAMQQRSPASLEKIIAAMHTANAFTYARNIAKQEAQAAITHLQQIPDSPYRTGLIDLAHFAVERSS
jgi:octaprenyl-diphosphate synthase